MKVHIQMFFISRDGLARHTEMGLACDNAKATRAHFNSHRVLDVAGGAATFAMDLYDGRGDLEDTIFLSNLGFMTVTGQPPKSEADYLEIDRRYWEEARRGCAHG